MNTFINHAQQRAVLSDAPTILCIAGAGSGKTKTLIERIARLATDGRNPRSMVAITFTTQAAAELQHRLNGLELGFCGTLHGFMLRLLTQHALELGLPSKLTVIDEEQAQAVIDDAVRSMNYKGTKGALTAAIAAVTAGTKPKPDLAVLTAGRVVNELRRSGMLTFDMVLSEGLRLLQWLSATPYSYLFVDEFQDSADVDARIYDRLPIANKFYVGDSDQAIFGFRGGNVQNILDLRSRAETILLEANYRSDQAICEAAQHLISHNTNREPKRTLSISNDRGEIKVVRYGNASAELVGTTEELMNAGGSCAVLLRSNKLVDQFSEYLEGVGVKVCRRQRNDRPSDWAVARAALAMLNNPENDSLVYWFMRRQSGEEKARALKLQACSQGKSLNDLCHDIPSDLPPTVYTKSLRRYDISQESLELIDQAVQQLPEGATGSDLLIALAESDKTSHEEGQGVTVTTIHAAKGREWSTVIIGAAEDEVIPGTAKSRSTEEERRLFYVAMTRAKHRLVISYCEQRKPDFGGYQPLPVNPSRFIKEAGL